MESSKLEHIQQAFPLLRLDDVVEDQDGLVHEVLIVNRERVFRFPRGEWGRRSIDQELKVLKLLIDRVPVDIPCVDYRDEVMVSYRYLDGRPLTAAGWDQMEEETRQVIAHQLAGFLEVMHETPAAVLNHGEIGRSETVRSRQEWQALYENTRETMFPYLMATARDWVESLFAPMLTDPEFLAYEAALMNGDIGTYHLLFDESRGRLSGILDFGTAGLGDPAADLACLLFQYGERLVRRVAEHYPAAAGMIDRARFWAQTLELEWAMKGLAIARAQERPGARIDWSWFFVHIGLGTRDIRPVGAPF